MKLFQIYTSLVQLPTLFTIAGQRISNEFFKRKKKIMPNRDTK